MSVAHLSTPLQKLLYSLSGLEGRLGSSARRKLRRRMAWPSMKNFLDHVARLGTEDIVIDLGANMGIFTDILAATGAEVHAYEPDPHCFEVLLRRFEGAENVHLHNQAVSGEAGTFVLQRTKGFAESPDIKSQSSSIAITNETIFDTENGILVETVAFKDVVRNLGRPVALVKMDIEGAEFSILDRILEDHSKGLALPIGRIFIETHERFMPERVIMVKELRMANWTGALPYPIDTFWA